MDQHVINAHRRLPNITGPSKLKKKKKKSAFYPSAVSSLERSGYFYEFVAKKM